MCTGAEMALISAAVSAGGTLMQADAASDAANKQQQILSAAEEENQRLNQAGEETVNDFAQKAFGAEERSANYEQAATERESTLANALSESAPSLEAAGGNVSSDYLKGSQASTASAATEAARRAKLVARTGAGGLLYGKDSMMSGQLASDLGGIGQKARRNSQYAQNAAGQVQGGSLAGGLLSGLGAAGMSYGGSMGGSTGLLGDGLSQGDRRKIGVF